MDFKARVQFGRTERMVSRLGLASGYGVPTAAIEKAFHEHGVNYFYLSLLKRGQMVQAIRNLAAHRDELFIVLARPTTYFLERLVERWLRRLGVGQIDAVLLQDHRKPPPPKLVDGVHRLRESGKARFVGAGRQVLRNSGTLGSLVGRRRGLCRRARSHSSRSRTDHDDSRSRQAPRRCHRRLAGLLGRRPARLLPAVLHAFGQVPLLV